ncbi:MAG TPA: ABC transporter substrate-binding protein [Euzebyales bacterium]|nr:ABC transporter substrate-binding protein [Euzebyales bacterium]
MHRRSLSALLVVIALIAAACGGGRDTEAAQDDTSPAPADDAAGETEATEEVACGEPSAGITDDTVRIGGIYPLSGPASAYGAIPVALQAYIDYVNEEQGGAPGAFEGRTIEYTVEDDAYSPPNTVEAVRKLVEQDEVFALYQVLGTPPNAAIWDYTNEQEVPQLFVATGATMFGLDTDNHPWTMGWQPNYVAEARVYAQYLMDEHPEAKVAVLFQNDDYGMDYLDGFKQAIEGSDIEVVAEQSYETTDATIDSQMTNLARSEADVFFNITTPSFAAQAMAFDAQSDWDVVHLLNNVSASLTTVGAVGFEPLQGLVTAVYTKDAADPQWDDDEDMQLFLEKLEEYAPSADPNDGYVVYGWAVGDALYKVMEQTECPTREALMEAARSLDGVEVDLLLPGVTMNTGEDDAFPLEAMQIAYLEGEQWALQGDVIDTRETFGPVSDAVE